MKEVRFKRRNDQGHWVGDGFPVRSIFSYQDIATEISPFLLMDYGGPTHFPPTPTRKGVGPHPHRGFETVTLVYSGEVEHRDTSGGGGIIGPGEVQWMTAASGVVHEEFHGPNYASTGGPFEMIQLWVNLPARMKMGEPGYQGITLDRIPEVLLPGGAGKVRVIAGDCLGVKGPARTHTPIRLWDMRLNAGKSSSFKIDPDQTTLLFVLSGGIETGAGTRVSPAELAVLEEQGDGFEIRAIEDSKVLFLGGEPLNEPIVGYGPFVMNTEEEIRQAFIDYRSGRMGRLDP